MFKYLLTFKLPQLQRNSSKHFKLFQINVQRQFILFATRPPPYPPSELNEKWKRAHCLRHNSGRQNKTGVLIKAYLIACSWRVWQHCIQPEPKWPNQILVERAVAHRCLFLNWRTAHQYSFYFNWPSPQTDSHFVSSQMPFSSTPNASNGLVSTCFGLIVSSHAFSLF